MSETKVYTNWTEATTNPNKAMAAVMDCIEREKNAWIEVRKNGDQEFPIRKKNPLLDNPFNWQFAYGGPRVKEELAKREFFNDTEKDLVHNWVSVFGTKEAIEAYQKDGTISAEMFKGGISHPVRIKDANYYRKHILGDGYEYGFFVDHWKPKDGIPYYVVDDSIDKVFVICYTNEPVDKKEALMRAGRFLINCAEEM